MSFFWFKNANYIDVKQNDVVEHTNIKIENGKISEIVDDLPSGESEVIDCTGKYLTPGLIDAHTHLAFGFEAKEFVLEIPDKYHAVLSGLLMTQKYLQAGITTVRDCGGLIPGLVVSLASAIRKGYVGSAADIVSCDTFIQGTFGSSPISSTIADTPDEIIKTVRQLKSAGADFIKVMATANPQNNPRERELPTFSTDQLKIMVEQAHRLNMKVSAHAKGKIGIMSCIDAGVDSIEHGGDIPLDYLEKMNKNGIVLEPTLNVYHKIVIVEKKLAKTNYAATHRAEITVKEQEVMFKNALKTGIKIAVGTDGGPADVLSEMLMMQEYGMPAINVIKAATITNAELLDRDESIGSIEVGKNADILVLPADPINDLKVFGEDIHVYQNGVKVK